MITSILSPPTYIVSLLMSGVAGFRRFAGEKSSWEVYARYKNVRFRIRDWKRSTWSIDASEDTTETRKLALGLKGTIENAGKILEDAIAPALQKKVQDKNFFLLNSYHMIRPIYEYFRVQVSSMLQEQEKGKPVSEVRSHAELKKNDHMTAIPDHGKPTLVRDKHLEESWNRIIKHMGALSHNTGAMVAFFFSYLELLFDILLAFDPRQTMTFREFRNLTWSERFCTVLPVATDKKIAQIYQWLLEIKRGTRDVLLHGFGGDQALLVPLSGFGLVPVLSEALSGSLHFSWPFPFSEDDARRAIEVFSAFDDWASKDRVAQYALLYAESGFEIPFEQERLDEIRQWMSSPEDFQEALREEAEMRDRLQDLY